MATRKTTSVNAQPTKPKSHIPEGFKSARADKAEYFVKPFEGMTIHGQLLGRYPKKGRYPGYYYQVRVFAPVQQCEHRVGPQEYEGPVECPVGEIVSIDEKGGLKCMERYADGTQEVYIYCGAKRDIGDGQTAWDFEVGYKTFDPDNVPF